MDAEIFRGTGRQGKTNEGKQMLENKCSDKLLRKFQIINGLQIFPVTRAERQAWEGSGVAFQQNAFLGWLLAGGGALPGALGRRIVGFRGWRVLEEHAEGMTTNGEGKGSGGPWACGGGIRDGRGGIGR
jgi:hypothetical protein